MRTGTQSGVNQFISAVLLLTASAALRGQSIKGKVTVANTHAPVANAVVSIKEKPGIAPAISQKDGTFSLAAVPGGLYTLVAKNSRFFTAEESNVQPGQTVELQLTEISYSMAGTKIYADLDVNTATKLLPVTKSTNDTAGEYLLLNRLAIYDPNSYQADASAAEQKLRSHPAVVTGMVKSTNGGMLAGANVKLFNSATGEIVQTKTDSTGHYRVALFPIGSYKLQVDSGMFMADQEIQGTVAPNSTLTEDVLAMHATKSANKETKEAK
jgi:hypothetical protein